MKISIRRNQCTPTLSVHQVNNSIELFISSILIDNSRSPGSVKVLDTVLGYGNIYNRIEVSHNRIAERAKQSRDWAIKSLGKHASLNRIISIYNHRHPNTYLLNPLFWHPKVRKALWDILPSLKKIPVFLLASSITFSNINSEEEYNQFLFRQSTPTKESLSFPSPIPNNHLSNINHHLNQRSSMIEQGNNKDTSSVTSRNTHTNNDFSLKKETVMINKIKQEFNLGEIQTGILSQYSDEVIREGYKGLLRAKTPPSPQNRFNYLISCCKNAKISLEKKSSASSTKSSVGQMYDADLGIVPTLGLSFDENVQRWDDYEFSKKTQDYMNQDADKRGHGQKTIEGRKRAYMAELERMNPDIVERRKRIAQEYQKQFPYTKEGILGLGELFGIKQESSTINEVTSEQPNTQEIKKDSIAVKLDIKSAYEEKYKDHEQIDQIKAWLKTVSVDDGQYEEIYD